MFNSIRQMYSQLIKNFSGQTSDEFKKILCRLACNQVIADREQSDISMYLEMYQAALARTEQITHEMQASRDNAIFINDEYHTARRTQAHCGMPGNDKLRSLLNQSDYAILCAERALFDDKVAEIDKLLTHAKDEYYQLADRADRFRQMVRDDNPDTVGAVYSKLNKNIDSCRATLEKINDLSKDAFDQHNSIGELEHACLAPLVDNGKITDITLNAHLDVCRYGRLCQLSNLAFRHDTCHEKYAQLICQFWPTTLQLHRRTVQQAREDIDKNRGKFQEIAQKLKLSQDQVNQIFKEAYHQAAEYYDGQLR